MRLAIATYHHLPVVAPSLRVLVAEHRREPAATGDQEVLQAEEVAPWAVEVMQVVVGNQ